MRLVLLAALALCACAASGVKVSEEQLSQLKVGQSTYPDAVALLGKPTSTTLSANGYRSAVWSYARVTTRPETFIPIVGAFVGGSDVKSNAAVLMFGPDGRLTNWHSASTGMGTGTGLESGATPQRVDSQPRN